MALVTVGTAQNARITVRPKMQDISQTNILQARSGYSMLAYWWDDEGIDGLIGLSAGGGSLSSNTLSNHDWESTFVLEIIDSTLTVSHGGILLSQVTNTAYPSAGVWAYDDAYVTLVSFETLDVKPSRDVTARPTASASTTHAAADRIGGIRVVAASASSPSQASAESSRIGGVRSLFTRASALSAATALVERIRPSTATFTSRASSSASASVVRRGGVRVVAPLPITVTSAVRTGYHLLTAALSRPRGLWGDVITVWRKGPEVDYHATWRREIITDVRLEERDGAVAALNGMQSMDGAVLYIKGRAGLQSLTAEDRFTLGESTVPTPPNDALTVTSTESHRLRGRLHHWEVAAK